MSVKVEFVLSSKEIDVNLVDSLLNIQSSHIRKDYPPMSIAFPEWWIEITEESLCIDKTVWLLIQSLADKKQIITQICQKFHITPCLIIRVNSSYENRPEFVLSPRTITFFSELSAEIMVDLEPVYHD